MIAPASRYCAEGGDGDPRGVQEEGQAGAPGARRRARVAAQDDAHPPLRGARGRRCTRRRRSAASCTWRSARRRRSSARSRRCATRTTSSPPTARTGTRSRAGRDPTTSWPSCSARSTGRRGGRGGSMHMFDLERRFMGGYGIVGGNLPLGAGLALASDYQGTDDVTLCVFGDGASNQGTFGETMNLAALWKLPIVFMVTNNQFGMGTALERHSAVTDLKVKGESFGVPGVECDGMDVLDTYRVTCEAVKRAREERQPILVEAETYRFRGHSMADPEEYRTKEQVEEWRKKDPIETFARRLVEDGRPRGGRASRSSTRRSSSAIDEAVAVRRRLRLPDARVALRRHLRPRRPGQGLVLGRRARRGRAQGRGRGARWASGARAAGYKQTAKELDDVATSTDDDGRSRRPSAEGPDDPTRPSPRTTPDDGRHALPRGAERRAARGDGARRERLPHGRGHRRLQRRVQGHRTGCSRSSARSASATRRSPRTRSSAWASARRWAGCARSSS